MKIEDVAEIERTVSRPVRTPSPDPAATSRCVADELHFFPPFFVGQRPL